MGKHQNKPKRNIPLRVAALLFYLTLCTTYLVSGLFARYTASSQSGDQARVAKFSIRGGDALSQTIQADVTPGPSTDVSLVIFNESEVAVEYTVEVAQVTNNLPLSLSLANQDGAPILTQNGTQFTARQLPGNHTDKYSLKIEWTNTGNDLALMGMVDHITVTVTATQID